MYAFPTLAKGTNSNSDSSVVILSVATYTAALVAYWLVRQHREDPAHRTFNDIKVLDEDWI